MNKLNFAISDIISLDDWDELEERPTGSRAKVSLSNNKTNQLAIFKEPKNGREHQIWSELISSFICGDLLEWPVQTTQIGTRDGVHGNVLHYIYNPDQGERLIEGWHFCQEICTEYDAKRGTHHSLPLIEQVYNNILRPRYGISEEDYIAFWSRAIAFDTLISNTDRHAENWGIIVGPAGGKMAPLYDNATSMGCQLEAVGLGKCFDKNAKLNPDNIAKFIENGKHHLRINGPTKFGTPFIQLCNTYLEKHPKEAHVFEKAMKIDLSKARGLLDTLIKLEFPLKDNDLANRRADHIYAILLAGQQRIKCTLGA